MSDQAEEVVDNLTGKGLDAGIVNPVQAHDQANETQQWGYVRLGGNIVAPQGFSGAGIVVAVLDTGIDSRHPEFGERVMPGYDFISGKPMLEPFDDAGHGTHVAGIIAAALDQTGVAGLANKAKLLPVKVLDETGYGDDAGVARGLVWAVDNGADVINMSLGTYDDNPAMRAAVEYAQSKGVAVVASAGNDRAGGPASYPAAYPQALAVAATAPGDARAFFSTTGTYVDIAAPGQSILSTFPGNRYTTMSGTSMAAPFVSAGVAIVAAHLRIGTTEAAQVLLKTALDIGPAGVDKETGDGLMNLPKALGLETPLPEPSTDPPLVPEVPGGGTTPTLPQPTMPELPPLTPPTVVNPGLPALTPPTPPALPAVPSPGNGTLPPQTAPVKPPQLPVPPLPGNPGAPTPGAQPSPAPVNPGPAVGQRIAIAALETPQAWRVQVQMSQGNAGKKVTLRTTGDSSRAVRRAVVNQSGVAIFTLSKSFAGQVYATSRGQTSRAIDLT